MNYSESLHSGQDYMILPSEESQPNARSSNIISPSHTGSDKFALLGKSYEQNIDDTTNMYQWSNPYDALVTSAQIGVQTTMTEHEYFHEPSMQLNPQSWPTFINSDTSFTSLRPETSPYNASFMSNSKSIAQCTPDLYLTESLSSTYSAPVVSQSDPFLMQDAIHPVASFPPQPHHTAGAVNAEQDTRQFHNTRTPIFETEEDITTIGSVLSNGKLLCAAKGCEGLTFGRQAELRRHHTTLHAAIKPNFWCQVSNCQRSENAGGRAFHRKDKLAAHVKSMHSDAHNWYA